MGLSYLVNGKREFLGAFKTEVEAALAYDKRAKIAYGDFAVLNFKNAVIQDNVDKLTDRLERDKIKGSGDKR